VCFGKLKAWLADLEEKQSDVGYDFACLLQALVDVLMGKESE